MASTQVLKQRIRSVKSTKQITKAMQLVSASKMRRAQESTKASAPYTESAKRLLGTISRHDAVHEHILFRKKPVKSRLLVVIASDKGLAGAYNSNIFKKYAEQIRLDIDNGVNNKTITVGRKVSQFASKIKDLEVIGAYENIPDKINGDSFRSIIDMVMDAYVSGQVDAVDVIYTNFVSSIKQDATVMRLLPAGLNSVQDDSGKVFHALYEPGINSLIRAVAYRLIGAQLFQSLLDSKASEHSMRMIAMKNSTDNATDLIEDLTLAKNKARQGAITQELAEISGSVEALNV